MGFDVIDTHLLGLIHDLRDFYVNFYSDFTTAGSALGALLILFVVAGEAYQVMIKHKGFDILGLMRPLALGLVIANWIPFTSMIGAIPNNMEIYAKSVFDKAAADIVADRENRTKAAEAVYERTKAASAAAEMAKEQIKDGNTFDRLAEFGSDFMDMMQEQVASFGTVMQAKVNQVLEEWVMKLGEIFWQISIYLLFFIKEVMAGILIITGPITFALSVLPIWKDAWSQWISRYVSVMLYGFVGFFLLAGALQMVKYGIRMDTKVLEMANSSAEAFSAYTQSSIVTALYHFVCLMVGAFALKFVPEISTWIIPSSASHGAKEFVGGMSSAINGGASKAVGMAIK